MYDAAGVRVARLHDGIQSRGEHELTWNADGFGPGVYFGDEVRAFRVTKAD